MTSQRPDENRQGTVYLHPICWDRLPPAPIRLVPGLTTISETQMRLIITHLEVCRLSNMPPLEIRLLNDDRLELELENIPYPEPNRQATIYNLALAIRSLEQARQGEKVGRLALSLLGHIMEIANRLHTSFDCEDDDDALLELNAVLYAALRGFQLDEFTKRGCIVERLLGAREAIQGDLNLEQDVKKWLMDSMPIIAGSEERLAVRIVVHFEISVADDGHRHGQIIRDIGASLAASAPITRRSVAKMAHIIVGHFKRAAPYLGNAQERLTRKVEMLAESVPLMAGREVRLNVIALKQVLGSTSESGIWEPMNALLAELELEMKSPDALRRGYYDWEITRSQKIKDK